MLLVSSNAKSPELPAYTKVFGLARMESVLERNHPLFEGDNPFQEGEKQLYKSLLARLERSFDGSQKYFRLPSKAFSTLDERLQKNYSCLCKATLLFLRDILSSLSTYYWKINLSHIIGKSIYRIFLSKLP